MKVEENSDARLVVAHRPWLLSGAVLLVALVTCWAALTGRDMSGPWERGLVTALGLGALAAWWQFFPFTRTVFDRAAGIVVHAERRLTGTRLLPLPLDEVEGAQVDANWSDDGARLTRLTLLHKGKRVPLERGYGPADRRAVERVVNEWLTRPTA